MPDRLTLLALPTLRGERVILREPRVSDIDDRLRHPIDPDDEDGYGSAWRREWDGSRYHGREHLAAGSGPAEPGRYTWAVERQGRCIGSAGLRVDAGRHCASCTVGLFAAGLRGRGLGREITKLVLSWAFDALGVHRVELQVLAGDHRAISCYRACGFRQEGVRRQAELYPDGWNDFLLMGLLRSEYLPQAPENGRADGHSRRAGRGLDEEAAGAQQDQRERLIAVAVEESAADRRTVPGVIPVCEHPVTDDETAAGQRVADQCSGA
jgi:ribosomal-protein-alanine N-acetyltransferase